MTENEAELHNLTPTVTDETLMTDVSDAEEIACSPAKKKTKLDTERIIMGEELADLEINSAQGMLKEQFHHINGLQSTLL